MPSRRTKSGRRESASSASRTGSPSRAGEVTPRLYEATSEGIEEEAGRGPSRSAIRSSKLAPMPRVSFHVADDVVKALRRRAKMRGQSVSAYVAAMVLREVHPGWPEDYFEEVIGGWKGPPLTRPSQGGAQ